MMDKPRRGAIPAGGYGGKKMKEYFIDQARNHLAQMRLLVEGGIVLYEEISPRNDPLLLDLVGEALYTLRSHITECQDQLQQEISNIP